MFQMWIRTRVINLFLVYLYVIFRLFLRFLEFHFIDIILRQASSPMTSFTETNETYAVVEDASI